MSILTITFDDGYKDTYSNTAEHLINRGVKATFAIPSDHISGILENRPVMDKNDILYLQSNGHEIAAHTGSHVNLLSLFNTGGKQAVLDQLSSPKVVFQNSLGITPVSFVFPFIERNNNAELRGLASEHYRSSRITSDTFSVNPLPVNDPFSITGTAITTSTDLPTLNGYIDSILDKNVWLIEVFHLVSAKNTKSAHRDAPYGFFTHIDIFMAHLDHIQNSGITLLTQKDAIASFTAR
ncbi:MAG: polysaccharide deacetylase family protein [Candidatus Omnitrophica bacterium]|nr:polysaccharide deacetylase family protein [Candidatus Omnitrophota bacterium]